MTWEVVAARAGVGQLCGMDTPAPALALLLAASLGACGQAPPQQPFRPEPNTGTAPDWIANCIARARSEFNVDQAAVRLQLTEALPQGGFVGEGSADRGAAGRVEFRCVTNPDDSVRSFDLLPLDGQLNPEGNRQ